MAQTSSHTLTRDQFLTIAVNLLHRAFVESPRTDAKNLYRALAEGKRVALTNLKMDDGSTVRFDLSLDHSEFVGTLNYGAFRASLRSVLGNIAQALQEKKDFPVFTAQNEPNRSIFGITGVTVEDGTPAVMVLASITDSSSPAVLLQLAYLDHTQFAQSQPDLDATA
ncbi:hypothetical protein [Haliea sp. E17]|uniref:hypothetical protein n=1 Tax=Haliea sp. E17 TaxID=3401576 RepID=UPI003AAC2E38